MAAHSSVAYPPPPAPAVLPHNALGLRGLRSVECGGASSPSCLPFLTSYPASLPIPRPCILVVHSPEQSPGASWQALSWPGALLCCQDQVERNSDAQFLLRRRVFASPSGTRHMVW